MCVGCVDRTLNVTVDAMALRMSLSFSTAGTLGPVLSAVIADLLGDLIFASQPLVERAMPSTEHARQTFYEPAIVSIVSHLS